MILITPEILHDNKLLRRAVFKWEVGGRFQYDGQTYKIPKQLVDIVKERKRVLRLQRD